MLEGRRNSDDEGSVYRYVVFDRRYVEALLGKKLERTEEGYWPVEVFELIEELTGFYDSSAGCIPGRWFWSGPSVRVGRNRVLVKQFGGYDI